MNDTEPEYLIVLYSKYSKQCQKVLELYDEALMTNIRLVCIDNSTIRKRLAASSIKTVPCILFVYKNNKVEKFEGPSVTNWIIQKMTDITAPPTQAPPQIIPSSVVSTPAVQQIVPSSPQQQAAVTQIQDLDFISESEITNCNTSPMRNPIQSIKPERKEKSLAERAAEMAAAREGADKPAHIQMQEMHNKQIETSINGGKLI